jgi:hypothetical protein
MKTWMLTCYEIDHEHHLENYDSTEYPDLIQFH